MKVIAEFVIEGGRKKSHLRPSFLLCLKLTELITDINTEL